MGSIKSKETEKCFYDKLCYDCWVDWMHYNFNSTCHFNDHKPYRQLDGRFKGVAKAECYVCVNSPK